MTYKEIGLANEAWEYLTETEGTEALVKEIVNLLDESQLAELVDKYAVLHNLDERAGYKGYKDFWHMIEWS